MWKNLRVRWGQTAVDQQTTSQMLLLALSYGVLITLNIRATPIVNTIACHCNNIWKPHNLIVRREISHITTVRAAVENLMLFSLYKIFVRSCKTPTNHSHEPLLLPTSFSIDLATLWKKEVVSIALPIVTVN